MLKPPLLILLFPALLIIPSCALGFGETKDLGPQYEALTWLESNPNPHAFAGNRFHSTEDSIAFVEILYDVGAVEVLVTNVYDEYWRIESVGCIYADILIIRLPRDSEKWILLFKIENEEAGR